MTASAGTILLIEDDPEIIRSVSALCASELGMSIESHTDGAEGLSAALQKDYGLVIVDANLPSKSGFDICRELRAKKPNQSVMFLTGRAEEIDKVVGFELGADDYVTKPFGARELVARIKSLLRRMQQTKPDEAEKQVIIVRDIKIDLVSRRVWKRQQPVQLTLVEYELLALLAASPGRTFERRELLQLVLGYSSGGHEDVLTVHFSRLRAKIEDDSRKPALLKTVRGIGYRFAAADEVPGDSE